MNPFNLGSGICLPCSTTLFEMPLDVVLKILKKKKNSAPKQQLGIACEHG